MEDKVDESLDLISDLPVSILHHILSFLPLEDSVKTSVLSKQWNSVQMSYPILKFDMSSKSGKFKERRRKYLDFVDRSLQIFSQNKFRIDKMSLYVWNIYPKPSRVINTWLPLALHNGVSDLFFSVELSEDYYSLPETTFSVNSSLLLGSSEFFRLKKLNLTYVGLTEEIVSDIICNCPNLADLQLEDIRCLKTLNIPKPNKLERLYIMVPKEDCEVESIFVDAPSLTYFEFHLLKPCAIDLSSCYNLSELNLRGIDFTDALYHMLIAIFPLLVDLIIEDCHFQAEIWISLKRLKHLEIDNCTGLEVIELDAPILSKFDFNPGEEEMPSLVSEHDIPCSMHLRYDMQITYTEVNSFWFHWIRVYLDLPFKSTSFYPYHDDMKEFDNVSFDIGELINEGIPPLVEIDCLDFTDSEITRSSYWETLLNGLLWSCHPKTVRMNITPDSNDGDNCIKIFCRMLMQRECKICCNLDECKCWRYRLKSAKLESSEGISLDIEKSIEGFEHDLFLHNPDSEELEINVIFSLNWDHSENPE